jgi:hypothetical protein
MIFFSRPRNDEKQLTSSLPKQAKQTGKDQSSIATRMLKSARPDDLRQNDSVGQAFGRATQEKLISNSIALYINKFYKT